MRIRHVLVVTVTAAVWSQVSWISPVAADARSAYEYRMRCPYEVPVVDERPWRPQVDAIDLGAIEGLSEVPSTLWPKEWLRVPFLFSVTPLPSETGPDVSGQLETLSFHPRLGGLRRGGISVDLGFSMFQVATEDDPSISPEPENSLIFGNLMVAASYARASSSFPDLYRRYIALTGVAHLSPLPHEYSDGSDPSRARAHQLAAVGQPFQRARFLNQNSLQLMLDWRYEILGCHGLFIHFRGGLDGYDVSWNQSTDIAGRFTVSVGGRPLFSRDAFLVAEYSVLFGLNTQPGHEQVLNLGARFTSLPAGKGRWFNGLRNWVRGTVGVFLGLPIGAPSGYTLGLDVTIGRR